MRKSHARLTGEARRKRMAYPECDDQRCGCKVSWRIYKDRVLAEACSVAARHNGEIDAALGYDFGYCAPGSITKLDDGRFEVCIP